MDFAEKFNAAYLAIQAAQTSQSQLLSVAAVGGLMLSAAVPLALRCVILERWKASASYAFVSALSIATVFAIVLSDPEASVERALAEKQAVCDQAIEKVVEDASPDLVALALQNECSHDKLLIAALSSGNGLSAKTAKALIREFDDSRS